MFKKIVTSITFASLLITSTGNVYPFWGKNKAIKKTKKKLWLGNIFGKLIKKKKPPVIKKTKINPEIIKGLAALGVSLGIIATYVGILLTAITQKQFGNNPNNKPNNTGSKKANTSFDKDFAPGTINPAVQEIRDNIKYLDKEDVPKTILLYGPTSTGKTHAAKALANELGADVYMEISGPELRRPLVGSGQMLLNNMFQKALDINRKTKKPGVIIINEIDGGTAGLNNRFKANEVSREITQTLQALLDRDEYKDIYLIATSNYVTKDDIPQPLAERFVEQIKVDVPNEKQRKSIVNFYADKHSLDINLDEIDFEEKTKNFNIRRLEKLVKKIRNRYKKEQIQEAKKKAQEEKEEENNKDNKAPEAKIKTAVKENRSSWFGTISNKVKYLLSFSWLKKKAGQQKEQNDLKKEPKPKIKVSKEVLEEEIDKTIKNNIRLSENKQKRKATPLEGLLLNLLNQKNKNKKIKETESV